MEECKLDWHKVFKKILVKPQHSALSEECNEKPVIVNSDSKSTDSCIKEPLNYESSPSFRYNSLKKEQKGSSAYELNLNKPSASINFMNQRNDSPNVNNEVTVPDWNTVFKQILGTNSVQVTREEANVKDSKVFTFPFMYI